MSSNLSRRQCLKTGLMALGGLTLSASAQTSKKPNVLFIAVDDLRPELALRQGLDQESEHRSHCEDGNYF
jgi:hypothetical protein